MKRYQLLFSIAFCLFIVLPIGIQAQDVPRAPKRVKVATTKRPIILLLDIRKLDKFYLNFEKDIKFASMKTAKWEEHYYLLAKETQGVRIFAFELERRGKRLFLNKYNVLQTCDTGDLSLDTFLKEEGRITGCRLGTHTVKQLPRK